MRFRDFCLWWFCDDHRTGGLITSNVVDRLVQIPHHSGIIKINIDICLLTASFKNYWKKTAIFGKRFWQTYHASAYFYETLKVVPSSLMNSELFKGPDLELELIIHSN